MGLVHAYQSTIAQFGQASFVAAAVPDFVLTHL
jgi:hypothetical protein